VLETAVLAHAFVQGILPGVAERGVTQIVGQRDGFGKILVQAELPGNAAGNLGNLQTVRKPGPEMIAFVVDEDLGFGVLYSRRRNAFECTMRSRSRWNSLLPSGAGSASRRPREA
jgi:hypothetical protein